MNARDKAAYPAGDKLTVGSLFSGIGGLELGLERAGMDVRWQVEIDPFCRTVLARHWPDVPRYTDVTKVDFHELEPVDLICGGFPCQPFSHAARGRIGGVSDDRWLWPPFREAVRILRPRYVVVENVVGLRQRDRGALHALLGDLARLGFDAEWASLRAYDAGAPHRRERLVVVAYTDRDREPLFPVDEEVAGSPALPSPLRDGWLPEPEGLRVDDGVSRPVDRRRLSALGNAVVPQVAQWIGERIVAAKLEPGEVAA